MGRIEVETTNHFPINASSSRNTPCGKENGGMNTRKAKAPMTPDARVFPAALFERSALSGERIQNKI
ncbi:MAG TPA: hypothetical protein VMA74_09925 [Dyella sp.]|uniref:hypothetical protein n=1 Tax=Dyella sp. TaxID=1869338 RepID=UPI002BB21FD6|nr:hypothetical protein [Dyella sp.]HUB90029.1 hypothetical protein [Dyella sp.]